MGKKYYINSNNGDWVEYDDKIILVTDDGYREISLEEFNNLKGFIPIKEKKIRILQGRGCPWRRGENSTSQTNWKKYKPTQKGGIK